MKSIKIMLTGIAVLLLVLSLSLISLAVRGALGEVTIAAIILLPVGFIITVIGLFYKAK